MHHRPFCAEASRYLKGTVDALLGCLVGGVGLKEYIVAGQVYLIALYPRFLKPEAYLFYFILTVILKEHAPAYRVVDSTKARLLQGAQVEAVLAVKESVVYSKGLFHLAPPPRSVFDTPAQNSR